MSISKLRIENFKGIRNLGEFDIRPITLFIGPNSSGKSSCIHALAALAQTSKLPSSGRPLVLDDEYAQVHLGRFIEVIHTKKYTDPIGIGFESQSIRSSISGFEKEKKLSFGDTFAADFSFRSTKRTQDIYLANLAYRTPGTQLTFQLDGNAKYLVEYDGVKIPAISTYESSLNVSIAPKADDPNQLKPIFDAFLYNETCKRIVASELANVLYLGPFRQSPIRRYPTRGSSPTEVGAQGENAITLLANEYVQTKGRPHLKQISGWLHEMGLAKNVEVARVGKSDLFDVKVTLSDGIALPIADLGYGMSQVLPVLAQCSFAPERSTLLFEQPELHLNHSAAQLMAAVLVEAAVKKSLHIIAETHSRELFHGLLDQLRQKKLSVNDLAIYTVERKDGCSQFMKINVEVDKNGHVDVYDPWDKNL